MNRGQSVSSVVRILTLSFLAVGLLVLISSSAPADDSAATPVPRPASTSTGAEEAVWPPVFVGKFGSAGSGTGQFLNASGVAVNQTGDTVYVSDNGYQRVNKFDGDGNFILRWGSNGTAEEQFKNPMGMTVDGAGNLYVADSTNHRIQKYDIGDTFLYTFGNAVDGGPGVFEICTSSCFAGGVAGFAGAFNNPNDVAVDSDGNVYVADMLNHRVQKFDSSGNFLLMWGRGVDTGAPNFEVCTSNCQQGTTGSLDGEFNLANGIAATRAGIIYVTDQNNNRVQKFDSNGGYLLDWGSYGSGDGQFSLAHSIYVDAEGNVLVPDAHDRVQMFDADGKYLLTFGTPGTGDGEFDNAFDVSISLAGFIYVVDRDNDRVQVFAGPYYWLFKG